MQVINMQYDNTKCVVGTVNGKVQSTLSIRECGSMPCIYVHDEPKVLGNRILKKLTYVAPKRLKCNTPLMIENN